MKIYRIAAVLLAVTMAAGMLAACGEPEYEEGTTESETLATVQTEDVTDTQPATETVEEVVTEPTIPTTSSIGLTFTLNSNGKGYTCTGIGTCTDTDIVLDTYNGLPVTAIGYEAFRGCSQMTSISLPSTVNQIEQGAFWDCTGLTSVVIPTQVW